MKGFILGLLSVMALAGVVGAGLVATTRAASSAPITYGAAAPVPAQVQNPDMTITLSERFMNQQLQAGMPSNGDVRDVSLDLHTGNRADVNSSITVSFFGSNIDLRPRAALFLSVQNGRVTITVGQIDVGGFGIPSSLVESQAAQLRQTAEQQLNQQLTQFTATTGLKLQSAATSEDSVTLVFSQ